MIDVENKSGGLRVVLTKELGQEVFRGTFAAFLMGSGFSAAQVRAMARALGEGQPYSYQSLGGTVTLRREEVAPAGRTVELPAVGVGGALNLAEKILASRCTSSWLLSALSSALRRDPVDAAADAELLLSVLLARLEEVNGGAS